MKASNDLIEKIRSNSIYKFFVDNMKLINKIVKVINTASDVVAFIKEVTAIG